MLACEDEECLHTCSHRRKELKAFRADFKNEHPIVLQLQAIFQGLTASCPDLSDMHILVHPDVMIAIRFLVNFEGSH